MKPLPDWSDAELAAALAARKPEKPLVTEAYHRFLPGMLYAAAHVLGALHDHAEDVAQATLSRILLDGTLAHLKEPAYVRSFLDACARRAAIDVVRAARKHPVEEATADVGDWLDTRAAIEEREALKERLAEVLQTLSAEDRGLLEMRFLHELSLSDVARRLGVGYAAAGQRLHRALSRARKAAQNLPNPRAPSTEARSRSQGVKNGAQLPSTRVAGDPDETKAGLELSTR